MDTPRSSEGMVEMKMESDKSSQWTNDQIDSYLDSFKMNLITGEMMVNGDLNGEVLKNDLDVAVFAHRKIILKWAKELKIK